MLSDIGLWLAGQWRRLGMAALMAAATTPIIAKTILVQQDYLSIQSAIEAAENGDEIIVSPGVYYEQINDLGKSLIIRSTNPADIAIRDTTIIDGGINGVVVTLSNDINSSTVLSGFTIRNGKADDGAAIRGGGPLATVSHNLIIQNTASSGGIVSDFQGSFLLNKLTGNFSTQSPKSGALVNCNGLIASNIIHYNSTAGLENCRARIYNNQITLNAGHGIVENNTDKMASAIVINTTIALNEGSGLVNVEGLVLNCIIWDNDSALINSRYNYSQRIHYSCLDDATIEGIGNVYQNPQFYNPYSGNFSVHETSPCRDAGSTDHLDNVPQWDPLQNNRLFGAAVDMGCFETGSSLDTDGDFLSDDDEGAAGTDPNLFDTDGDGLCDGAELIRGTQPATPDAPLTRMVPDDISSIQAAIFTAFANETIIVNPGTYSEPVFFASRNIHLKSADPMAELNGATAGIIVQFSGQEPATAALDGFVVKGGINYPGAIVGHGTQAQVRRCRVTECYTAIVQCGGLMTQNVVTGNRGIFGGGPTSIAYCSGPIMRNNIYGNTSSWGHGTGLYECHGLIANNYITYNSSWSPGVPAAPAAIANCDGMVINNTIYGNTSSYVPSYRGAPTIYVSTISGCDGTFRNNAVFDEYFSLENADATYNCTVNRDLPGEGNIKSGDLVSPLIDTGGVVDLMEDYSGFPRPVDSIDGPRGDGSNFDIGADEYQYVITIPPPDGHIVVPGVYIPTIQAALDYSAPGAVIEVLPGEYKERLVFPGHDLTLRSSFRENGTYASVTIINADNAGSAITLTGAESPACVIDGLTITNGRAHYGGGINAANSQVTIRRCRIINNVCENLQDSTGLGGGIYKAHGLIDGCLIARNTALMGDGGGIGGCYGVIRNCIIKDNVAQTGQASGGEFIGGYGGGLRDVSRVENCTIAFNGAQQYGGGASDCDQLINSIVWGNTQVMRPEQPLFNFPEVYDVQYSLIPDWSNGGAGIIKADPLFANAASGNFSLLANSPCIDAGVLIPGVTKDYLGTPRPVRIVPWGSGDGSCVDIGALEYFALSEWLMRDVILERITLEGGLLNLADLNNNDRVDSGDLILFMME